MPPPTSPPSGPDEVDARQWNAATLGLPPLEALPEDLLAEMAIEDEAESGGWSISLGAEVAFVQIAARGALPAGPADLGRLLHEESVISRPTLNGLAKLVATDISQLDETSRIGALRSLETHRAWLDGLQQQLLAEIARADTELQWAADEVSTALAIAPATAQARLKDAQQLVDRLPATLRALLDGELSGPKASIITRGSYAVADDLLPVFEDEVLPKVAGLSVRQVSDRVRRAVIRLDSATIEARHQRAVSDRCVRVVDAGDGMSWLTALLPAEQALACYRVLTKNSRHLHGSTVDQRRADLVVAAILNTIDAAPSGGAWSERASSEGASDAGESPVKLHPVVTVTVDLDVLTGLSSASGWLDGYGPITAEHARQIAADESGTWRRLVTDPLTGMALDYGRTRYRPPKPLAELVIARHGTCVFPTCDRPAQQSDLDHTVPFPQGGTNPDNLAPLCRRHHRLKHQTGWTYQQNSDRTVTWTSPSGRTYYNQPPRRW